MLEPSPRSAPAPAPLQKTTLSPPSFAVTLAEMISGPA